MGLIGFIRFIGLILFIGLTGFRVEGFKTKHRTSKPHAPNSSAPEPL